MTNPTNSDTPDATSAAATGLPAVTLDRVIEAMKSFDITLDKVEGRSDAATANLNGLPCVFAVLDSVVIVRCDVGTDASYQRADAGLFLAANQINSVSFGARAAIAEHEGSLVVRTERDVPCAAGMSNAQLATALQAAVDGVISGQDAMIAAAEQMAKAAAGQDDAQE